MKTYDVYCDFGCVSIKAERVKTISCNGKPTTILFITKDEAVAEFYVEHTAGWLERKEESINTIPVGMDSHLRPKGPITTPDGIRYFQDTDKQGWTGEDIIHPFATTVSKIE